MHGHVRAGFSAFCLLLALPLTLPLLLPAIVEGNVWEISLTAVLPTSHIDVWAPLVVAAVLLLSGMALANRRRTADAGFDGISGVQRLDPMLVAEWADTVTESP